MPLLLALWLWQCGVPARAVAFKAAPPSAFQLDLAAIARDEKGTVA